MKNEDLTRSCDACDSRTDVDGHAAYLAVDHVDLAGVDAHSNLESGAA